MFELDTCYFLTLYLCISTAAEFTFFSLHFLTSYSWLTHYSLTVLLLFFCHFGCCRSPSLHVTSVSVTLEPVVLVGLGSPLLHRNRRTQRRRSPEKLYQKPAHPGAQCRSCSSSYKYAYTVCLILSCSLLCICHCSWASLWSSALHSHIRFCPSF